MAVGQQVAKVAKPRELRDLIVVFIWFLDVLCINRLEFITVYFLDLLILHLQLLLKLDNLILEVLQDCQNVFMLRLMAFLRFLADLPAFALRDGHICRHRE